MLQDLRIDALTDEQAELIPQLRDHWIAASVAPAKSERARAENAVAALYRANRLLPPQVVWCGSPMSLALTRALARVERIAARSAPLPDLCWMTARDAVEATARLTFALGQLEPRSHLCDDLVYRWAIPERTRSCIIDYTGCELPSLMFGNSGWQVFRAELAEAGLGTRVAARITSTLQVPTWSGTWTLVGQPIERAVVADLGDVLARVTRQESEPARVESAGELSVNALVPVQHGLPHAFLHFVESVLNRPAWVARYAGVVSLSQTAGWAVACERLCWLSDRHVALSRDDRGLLHAATGPAVEYPDGYRLWFWHGQRVPRPWIEERERLDPTIALGWSNAEQRNAFLQIVGGWSRVLERVTTRVIERDRDPAIGVLLEAMVPTIGRARFLRVQCGTGRMFVLPVPLECETARQANAWTYGLQAKEYNPEVRT